MSLLPGILQALSFHDIYLRFEVVGLGLLAYDYLLTFSGEVEFIWGKPFSPVTLIFAITRYLPFIDNTFAFITDFVPNISFSACKLSYRFEFWSFALGICVAEIILILRTLAIWHGDKRIGIFLGTLAIGFVIPVLFYASKYLETFGDPLWSIRNVPAFAEFLSKAPSCIPATSANHIIVFYVLFTIFEAIILLLTVLKARAYRSGPFNLFRKLYHDSIAYSTYLCVFSIINIVVALSAVGDIKAALIVLHRNLHSILTGRIILNIRRVGYEANVSEVPVASTLMFGDNFPTSPPRSSDFTDLSEQPS